MFAPRATYLCTKVRFACLQVLDVAPAKRDMYNIPHCPFPSLFVFGRVGLCFFGSQKVVDNVVTLR